MKFWDLSVARVTSGQPCTLHSSSGWGGGEGWSLVPKVNGTKGAEEQFSCSYKMDLTCKGQMWVLVHSPQWGSFGERSSREGRGAVTRSGETPGREGDRCAFWDHSPRGSGRGGGG